MTRQLVGYADVDAGLMWVGDPCYVMGDDASSRVHEWHDFCNKIFATRGNEPFEGVYKPLGEGVGVAVQTGYGDGTYPVYVEYGDAGRVKSVTVEFMGSDDDED